VTERLAGVEGGTPIFRLETGFGGGKSHALIATVHVAREGERLSEQLSPNFCAKTGGTNTMKIGPHVAYYLVFEGLETGGIPP